MNNIQFKSLFNMVSMYNTKKQEKYSFIDKISVTQSNTPFEETISYINRKGDKQYKRI